MAVKIKIFRQTVIAFLFQKTIIKKNFQIKTLPPIYPQIRSFPLEHDSEGEFACLSGVFEGEEVFENISRGVKLCWEQIIPAQPETYGVYASWEFDDGEYMQRRLGTEFPGKANNLSWEEKAQKIFIETAQEYGKFCSG